MKRARSASDRPSSDTRFWGYKTVTSTDATPNVTENNIGDLNGELKAVLSSDLSDGAKVAAIAELLGCRGADEIAKAVNKKVRTVERHYAELRKSRPLRKSAGTQMCGTQNCGNTQICVENPANLRTETPQICVVESPAPTDITTRPTKELPSEVSLLNNYSPLVGPPTPSKTPSKRGTRLSPDWQLPDDLLQWALLNFVHANEAMVRAEAEQFRDFWIAKTGASATKLDWTATWRNWCRNSRTLARAANPKPFNNGRMAYDEQKAAEVASLREYIARRGRGEEATLQ